MQHCTVWVEGKGPRLRQSGKMADMLEEYTDEFNELTDAVHKRCARIPDLSGGMNPYSLSLLRCSTGCRHDTTHIHAKYTDSSHQQCSNTHHHATHKA